ncbi:MAG TPA: energy transducer TonB [Sphingomicrobium sp.]|nr:energy transducer TonB [Sphingomicrobium sp.]
MSSYQGTAGRPDKAKAIAAVVAVHAALAFVILSGLNVQTVSRAVERLKTFNLAQPPPPPPVPPPPPKPRPSAAKKPEGAPAKRAEPTPVVAPPARIPLPSPIPAAKVAGTGSAATSGAAAADSGTGAGGTGNGGGGGGPDYSRFTPAQLIRNLTRGDYRSIAQGRLSSGRAIVSLRVEPTGVPSDCRVVRSSGDPVVDGGLCPLIEARLRFRPALDDHGRPIAYQLQYVATWSL